jgi:hypothetical protein
MRSLVVRSKFLLLLLAALAPMVGCGSGVQIARVPFVSPLVLPSANNANLGEFTLTAAVHNYGNSAGPDLWLNIYSEYWPNCTAAWCPAWPGTVPPPATTGPPNSAGKCLHVGALAPGAGWAVTDYTIDQGTLTCMQNGCPGHVWLNLSQDPECRTRFSGTNTGLHVNWAESGNLASMLVSDF